MRLVRVSETDAMAVKKSVMNMMIELSSRPVCLEANLGKENA